MKKTDYKSMLLNLQDGEFFTCPGKDILKLRGIIAYHSKTGNYKWNTKKLGNFYSVKRLY